jgi:hypothetical protein
VLIVEAAYEAFWRATEYLPQRSALDTVANGKPVASDGGRAAYKPRRAAPDLL